MAVVSCFASMAACKALSATGMGIAFPTLFGLCFLYFIGEEPSFGRGLFAYR